MAGRCHASAPWRSGNFTISVLPFHPRRLDLFARQTCIDSGRFRVARAVPWQRELCGAWLEGLQQALCPAGGATASSMPGWRGYSQLHDASGSRLLQWGLLQFGPHGIRLVVKHVTEASRLGFSRGDRRKQSYQEKGRPFGRLLSASVDQRLWLLCKQAATGTRKAAMARLWCCVRAQ